MLGESGRLYLVMELIGRGGFGTVHTASICGYKSNKDASLKKKKGLKMDYNLPKNEDLMKQRTDLNYAIKTEQKNPLMLEIDVLICMDKCIHFCKLIDMGVEPNTDTHFMVMTLCGPSLSDMRNALSNRHFSFSTTIRISMQVRTVF